MASSMPAPLHIILDSRYAKQDGWLLDDISLCSSGNIAVSGHRPYQSYVSIYGSTTTDDNSDSRDKPTLLYHKQFTDEGPSWPRHISFIKPNSTEIVTCRSDEVQVIDYNQDVVLRSRKVNGTTNCLSVSESQIFIGLWRSAIVNIYDNDLNEIKSIRLKGIRDDDWPGDIAAAADILCVCTGEYGRAIVYSQDSGSILTEYTTGQYGQAFSIAVNIQLGLTAIVWYQTDIGQTQISFYLLSENKSFLTVNVEFSVFRIRISDQGRIVTGDEETREVKVYNLEIETKRIQYGSRAKFQFIGKKKDKDEINVIKLEVYTYQDESHQTPFKEDVDMSLLLYGSKCIKFRNTEDDSGGHSGTVVPSYPESYKPSRCSLSGPSSSSEDKDQPKVTNQTEQQVTNADLVTAPIKDQPKVTNQTEQRVKNADLNTDPIEHVLKELGKSWKSVGRILELHNTVLNDIEDKYTEAREKSYQMLTEWIHRNGRDATYSKLIQALLKAGRKDLADDVEEWKGRKCELHS